MNSFERITIEGYRRLYKVQIDMRPLTVMISANGVGKTSLLEIFLLLAASAKGQLESKISDLSGQCKRSYSKTRDAASILRKNNLIDAVNVCPELKAFLNTILSLCEVDVIP